MITLGNYPLLARGVMKYVQYQLRTNNLLRIIILGVCAVRLCNNTGLKKSVEMEHTKNKLTKRQ